MAKPARFPFSFLLVVAAATLVLSGAGPRPASGSPYRHEQVLWASYWTVEAGYTSTLEMKNNRLNEPLTVRPSLYFASGEEYYLTPIQLGPRETVIVSINRVMAELPPSVAARAGKEGSLEIEFDGSNAAALMGSVSVTNPEKGIAWNFFMYPTYSQAPKVPVGGVFWLPNEKAEGFVVVHNASEDPMTVSPRLWVAGKTYSLPPVSLIGGQGYKLELPRELRRLGLNQVSAGGLEFTYEGTPDALKAHGVLFDSKGFSAEIDFTRVESWEEQRSVALRTPRFAMGSADPALRLPPHTNFEPVVALHNFNAEALALNLSVGYRNESGPKELQIPTIIGPGDTQVLRLHQYLQGVIPADQPWASLEVSYTANRNGLAAMMVSTSQDGRRSIRSVLNWVERSTREGWYWRADADHNTLLGIYNPDTEEARLAVWLDFYRDGARRTYEFAEVSVAPRTSQLLDIGRIILEQVPDTNGRTIPTGVSFGGYRVRKLERLGVNITTEALVIDHRTKNYLTIYNSGCCHEIAILSPSSLVGFVGSQTQLYVSAYDHCSESEEDLTWNATYWSGNGDVAYAGGAGAVQYTGPGFTTVYSSVVHYRDWGGGSCSTGSDLGFCGVTSRPKITSVSPGRDLVGATTTVTINGVGFGTNTSVQAGTGITVNISSSSSTQITANFVVASNAPGGNHEVYVTSGGQLSNAVNFFVQIPTKLVRTDYPGIPQGYGPLVVITDGDVVNVAGDVLLTHHCGMYRNLVYTLKDQQNPAQDIDGTYTLVESFSNYSSTYGGTVPGTRSFNMTPGGLLTDIQFIGRPASIGCPGSNDHEAFDQSHSVTIGTSSYPLTTVNRIERGNYSGTPRVDVTITTP